jgi:hypothetical protein
VNPYFKTRGTPSVGENEDMSFLDNLESGLKSLESAGEREDGSRNRDRRETERAARLAIQPAIDKLRKSPFTDQLLRAAHQESFRIRARISTVWIGDTLRLELRGQRLELRPAVRGVLAVAIRAGAETEPVLVNFDGDAAKLLKDWLDTVTIEQPEGV